MHSELFTLVKEFDSHAKHGQSFKKKFGRITEYFCSKNLTSGFVQVSESFFDRCTLWRKRRVELLIWAFLSRKERVCYMHRAEWERWARPSTRSIGRLAAAGLARERTSLKKCVFWLWGKDNLVQLPKTTHRYVNSGYRSKCSSLFSSAPHGMPPGSSAFFRRGS